MNLKHEINKRGIKYIWIAAKLGISPAHFTMLLNGQRKLSDERKKRIYDVITGRIS
jgi:plasmid maintenance system antidote protein VapI